MLNTRELEQRWLRYKIKSYIPHLIIGITLLIIIFLVIFFNNINKIDNSIVEETKKEVLTKEKVIKTKETTTLPVPTTQEIEPVKTVILQNNFKPQQNKQLMLKPSLNFMQNMKNATLPYYQAEKNSHKKSFIKVKAVNKSKNKKPITKKQTTHKNNNITKNRIIIKRQDSRDDIKNIISRFKQNNNPALSLFIAKKYYDLGEYDQAYNYALITNKINRDIEASWIVFTKSLVKLGKKEMAIKTLKEYIKSSYSSNARLLLEKIQSGKFQ